MVLVKKAFLCRTADRPGKRQFKHAVLEECIRIDDQQSRDVQLRVSGAVSDLHAAEARYHDKCSKLFFLRTFASPQQRHESQEYTYRQLIHTIRVDRTRMWTSVDVERTYTELGGTSLSRVELIKRVTSDLDNEIVVLSSVVLANILIFRDKASTLLRLVETTDTDDRNIDAVSKTIIKECKNIPINKDVYSPDISIHHAEQESSNTLLRLLSKISEKLNNTLPAYLIANIVTSTIQNKYTSLQIALGVLTRKKLIVDTLYDFGVTCSYAETIRFKASAAVDTATKTTFGSKVITDSKDGLIQVVADNFDVNISSQNGTKSTHALALITTQPKANTLPSETDVIKRISSEDVYKLVVPGIQIAIYNGRAKPQMLPFTQNQKGFPTLIELAKSVAKTFAVKEAEETSALFFRRILSDEKTPEFHGFCTMTKRESGASPKPSTNTFYSPLIDMTPHDPDCIMTAMTEAMRITHGCGQEYTVFTTDQQLYRVTLNVLWSHPSTFQKFIPRLGGMHMLMSFVGCVGKLMANSGLDVVMKSAFGGVPKMLLGKNFPQNTRALRIVVEEILNPLVKESTSFDNLMDLLKDKSQQSRTAKLWVECLIKPVFFDDDVC